MRTIEELTHDELKELVYFYDLYIQHGADTSAYEDGWYPVGMEEFLNNDLEVWKDCEQ